MMVFFKNRRRMLQVAAGCLTIGTVGVGIVLAQDLYVSREYVEIWGGESSMYPLVAKADKGAKLTVVEEDGDWLKVQYNGQMGYVYKDAVSKNPVQVDYSGLAKGGGGSESTGASAAAAGKGFTPTDFASAKGLSEEPLKKLEANVAADVKPPEFKKFEADGKIGDAKPRS
jgi:hypothetical protein